MYKVELRYSCKLGEIIFLVETGLKVNKTETFFCTIHYSKCQCVKWAPHYRDFSTVLRDIPPTTSAVVRLNTIGNNLNVYDDPVGHVNSAFDSTDFEVVNHDVQEDEGDEEEAEEDIVSHIQPFSRLDKQQLQRT